MSDLKYPLLAVVADPFDGFHWAVSHPELVKEAHVVMARDVVELDHRDVGEVAIGEHLMGHLDDNRDAARWLYAHELHLLSLEDRHSGIRRFVVGIKSAAEALASRSA